MFEEEVSTYDPLISGLEPEPLERVFFQLFSGMRHYITPKDTPVRPPSPDMDRIRRQEELSLHTPHPTPVNPGLEEEVEPLARETRTVTKTRQYSMLRCCCTEDFVSQFSLEHHETKYHSHFFNWLCSDCDIRFDTLQQASDHALMTHGPEQMPVCKHNWEDPMRPPGMVSVANLTGQTAKFVKDYLFSRGKQTVMIGSYFKLAKYELQAIAAGSVGLVVYNQAKAELLTTIDSTEYDDFISCMKTDFIYGKYIKRIPLENYFGPSLIHKTLTIASVTSNKHPQPVTKSYLSVGKSVERYPTLGSKHRATPYLTNQYKTSLKPTTSIRNKSYSLQTPAEKSALVRNEVTPYTLYPVRNINK